MFDGSIVEQVTDQLDDNQLRTKVISAKSADRTAIDVLDKPLKSNLLTAFDKYASQFAKDNSIDTIFVSFVSDSEIIGHIRKKCVKGSRNHRKDQIHCRINKYGRNCWFC